jgi:hypothetical protein
VCRVLKVSPSGYYAWRDRAPSRQRLANAALTERMRKIHQEPAESYGMPRIGAELLEQGHGASRKRIARLMRMAGIRGISRQQTRRGLRCGSAQWLLGAEPDPHAQVHEVRAADELENSVQRRKGQKPLTSCNNAPVRSALWGLHRP